MTQSDQSLQGKLARLVINKTFHHVYGHGMKQIAEKMLGKNPLKLTMQFST